MPITQELKNVKRFESTGFSHEQAEVLAETIEESHIDSQESLKEFISNKLSTEIKDLKYDLILKIFAIVSGTAGILFAMIKLFT